MDNDDGHADDDDADHDDDQHCDGDDDEDDSDDCVFFLISYWKALIFWSTWTIAHKCKSYGLINFPAGSREVY